MKELVLLFTFFISRFGDDYWSFPEFRKGKQSALIGWKVSRIGLIIYTIEDIHRGWQGDIQKLRPYTTQLNNSNIVCENQICLHVTHEIHLIQHSLLQHYDENVAAIASKSTRHQKYFYKFHNSTFSCRPDVWFILTIHSLKKQEKK